MDRNAYIPELAPKIAAVLGEGWTAKKVVKDYLPEWRLLGSNGAELYLNTECRNVDKLIIGGLVPQEESIWPKTAEAISVTYSRGPEVIAKEITRRLLPEYLVTLQSAQDKQAAHNTYVAAVLANRDKLQAAFGTRPPRDKDHTDLRIYHEQGDYGDIQPSDTTATLHLHSIPMDLAISIGELWAAYHKAKVVAS